jgi:hypothetical protein
MPGAPPGITDQAEAAGVISVDAVARASADVTTTTTADPGTTAPTTTLAVTLRQFNGTVGATDANYYIEVLGSSGIREVMLVTGGGGTGAGSLNVTRAQMGTTAVAHSVGAKVAKMVWVQRVEPIDGSKEVSFMGDVSTFDTLGRAGTVGQKLLAIHNATGSTVLVDVWNIKVDLVQAAAAGQAPTVLGTKIRLWKFTAVPTNGTTLTKVARDSTLSSKSTVTVWGDASADTVGSGTTLTVTLPAGTFLLTEFAPRMLLAAVTPTAVTYYEPFDGTNYFPDPSQAITLRPLEGLCVFLDYTVATGNPITNHWVASLRFMEYLAA